MFNLARGVVVGVLLVSLVACGGGGGGGGEPREVATLEPTPREKLAQSGAGSCEAVKAYVVGAIADLLLEGGYYPCAGCFVTMAGAVPFAEGAGDAADVDRFTGTNNQEAGVDELDRLEVGQDGHFYVLDGRHLVVARGRPPEDLREVGHLSLTDSGYPLGLVLDEANDRLVVAVSGQTPRAADLALVAPDVYFQPVVELLFVDVSDPAAPALRRRLAVEGFQLAVRRIGDRVHLVSHFMPAMPPVVLEDDALRSLQRRYLAAQRGASEAEALAGEIRVRVAALLADTPTAEFLPGRWRAGDEGPYRPVQNETCTGVAVPEVSMRFALTSVTSVGTDGSDDETLSLTSNAWQIYASRDHVYLIQTSDGWWWRGLQQQQTAIYQVAVGDGEPEYRGLGTVDGWIGSSFQLGEHEGVLRVATSRDEIDPATGSRRQDNHLFVLEDDGAGTLRTIGEVRGFAPGETIFSSRFLGPRGFVVTFRQVDPLFSFDLSDPRDPRLVGELEIPGFSTYLHPLDENHLLTIGVNGDDQGVDWRVRLQIFDVQDLARPRLVHALVPDFGPAGEAWSPATYDHLAFNYFAEAGMLTIPVQYRGESDADHFSGFASFAVSLQDGITELGRMDHGDLARSEYCGEPGGQSRRMACVQGRYLEAAMPSRAVGGVIGGEYFLFTVSDVGIKVANSADVATPLAVLPLPYPNEYWWWF